MLSLSSSVVLAAALLVACESGLAPGDPAGEGEAIAARPVPVAKPNPSFEPFAFAVDNCVETVDLTGTFHEVARSFIAPSGKEHFQFHINAKGTGVGRLTGARYQWNDRLFDITGVAPSGTVSFTLNDYSRLVGQGSAVNTGVVFQVKLTVTAGGMVTVDRVTASSRCG
jgi:hypothetical protein